jgi:oxygen-independent coproporphyrinogen-3 oxidase
LRGVDQIATRNAEPGSAPAFGVYIHWPFCLSKCPYCDFNSHVRHAAIDEPRFVRAFLSEIAANAQRVPGRTVTSIFFGGGTPSLMQPATVGAILDGVGRAWKLAPDVEVTLEPGFAATGRPASTGCRSACRRSTTARSSGWGAPTPRRRRSPPWRSRGTCSGATRSI